MSFNEVMSHAYKGCGTSLTAVRRSPKFRRVLAEQKRLASSSANCSCQKAQARRSGHFAVGRALNPLENLDLKSLGEKFQETQGHPFAEFEIEQRAHLIHLGQQITACARRYSVPRKFYKWARQWRAAKSANEQMLIAQKVCELLHEKTKKHEIASMHADMLNQPMDRVLPLGYGRWNPRADILPNCLGKAQLVQTFFEMCGAQTLSITPIRSASERVRHILGVVCHNFIQALKDVSFGESKYYSKLIKQFERDISNARYESQKPSWPHMGIAVKLCSARWAIVDPNFTGAQRISGAWMVPKIARVLDNYSEVLPGLTICHQHDEFDKLLEFYSMHGTKIFAEEYLQKLKNRKSKLRGKRAFKYVQDSDLLKLFYYFSSSGKDEKKKKKKAEDKKKWPPNELAAGIALCLLTWAEEQAANGVKVEEMFASGSFDDAIGSGEAQRILRGAVLDECLYRIVPSVFQQAIMHFDRLWKETRACDSFHPQSEFGCASYQLALGTFSHVGVDLGYADETAATMLRHGYGQFVLHNAATVYYRNPDLVEATPQYEEVVDHLAKLPFKLRSSQYLLEEIKKDGDKA